MTPLEEILSRYGIELDKFQLADLEDEIRDYGTEEHSCEEHVDDRYDEGYDAGYDEATRRYKS